MNARRHAETTHYCCHYKEIPVNKARKIRHRMSIHIAEPKNHTATQKIALLNQKKSSSLSQKHDCAIIQKIRRLHYDIKARTFTFILEVETETASWDGNRLSKEPLGCHRLFLHCLVLGLNRRAETVEHANSVFQALRFSFFIVFKECCW